MEPARRVGAHLAYELSGFLVVTALLLGVAAAYDKSTFVAAISFIPRVPPQ